MNSYRKLCTEFYDLDKPAPPPEALDFYREYARQARGRILEPMCGSGRFLLPLLAEGYAVEGVDASLDMIRACREHGARRGLQPIVHEQFLEQLDLPHRYGLVFIPAGSFGLLTDPRVVSAALARLLAHMESNARLVVEVERPDDGARIVISQLTRYDAARRVLESVHRYELVRNGQLLETEWEEMDVRLYEPAEFGALLADNGFVDVRQLDDTGRSLAGDGAMLFQCRRP